MFATTLTLGMLGCACVPVSAAVRIEGQVQASGGPLANSTVTLSQASDGAPKQLAQTKAGSDGRFEVDSQENPGADVILGFQRRRRENCRFQAGALERDSEGALRLRISAVYNSAPSVAPISHPQSPTLAMTP